MNPEREDIRSVGIYEIVTAPKTPIGTFDSERFKVLAREHLDAGLVNIVLDLGTIDTLYSDAFNALMTVHGQVAQKKGRMGILGAVDSIRNTLEKAGFSDLVQFFASESALMESTIEIMKQTNEVPVVSKADETIELADPVEEPPELADDFVPTESEIVPSEEPAVVEEAAATEDPERVKSVAEEQRGELDDGQKRSVGGWLVLLSYVLLISLGLAAAVFWVFGNQAAQ